VLASSASPALAEPLKLSGEASLLTGYTDEDLSVYTDGPTMQASLTLEHESGLYSEVWTNTGLTDHSGDEVDVTIGLEHELTEDLTIDAHLSYDDFREGFAQVTVGTGVSYKGASIRATYNVPTNGEAKGYRVGGSYTHEWYKFSLTPSLAHDTGAFDDVPPITVAGLKAEYEVNNNLSFSLSGLVPIAKKDYDTRDARVAAAITFRF
jgi:Bacterial protein of unknown function (Gcw_chp)